MPGGDDRHLVRPNRAAAGLDPGDPAARGMDRAHLAILDDVDTARIRGAGEAPGDRIMPRHPAAALQGGAEYGVTCVGRDVENGAEMLYCHRVEPFGVDAVEPIGIDPALALADIGFVVR